MFGSAAVHPELERLFVGVGGFAFGIGSPGIDSSSTAFLRALNWRDLSDAWVMAAYKAQSQVEGGFRFLKDPLFFVSSLVGTKPSRMPGLLMVMTLAL